MKIFRVGVLLEGFPSSVSDATRIEAFRKGLREIGYTEGKDISIEYRFAEGKRGRLTDLAAELVRLKVDDLWDGRDPCCQACHHDDPYCHDEQ